MQAIFLELVKLSLTGSLLALAVMALRLIFRKAPRWLFCLLWGVVALRLICPVSIESSLSLIPDRLASGQIFANAGNEYVGDVEIIYESNAGYSNAVEAGRQPIYSDSGYFVVTEKDSLEAPKTVGQTIYPVLTWIWAAGGVLMLAYSLFSYLLLQKKMEEATHLRENIWQCEQVDSPFVLGFLRPRIYLPYAISDSDAANVISHEQAHIRRKDHWWKPLGFLLLSIHWFNPVLWLAYVLLCRDIEAACDEKVIRHMEKDEMRAYSTALFHCSVHRRRIAACPLAFGEVGVKERVKRVMHYKKPAFWMIAATIAACCVTVIFFFTNPSLSAGALPNIHSHAYLVQEVTYQGGVYSFSVIAGENSPVYLVSEDMSLSSQGEVSEFGQWADLGQLEETTLTKENFDALFQDPSLWAAHESPESIRKNTAKAWRLLYRQEVLYYVLQQKNGDLYLAYGYQSPDPNADPGSFYAHFRWLFKLTLDTTGMTGMVAKSGSSAVPMVSFPKGTQIRDYVDSIYWLTIDPSDEAFAPFTVWKDGEEIRGTYTAYDAATFETLKHFVPSGLDPQTYLFQNADPTRGYIVLATFSTEPDAEIYAFGAKFADFDMDNSKLLSLVGEIAYNPDCAVSSNPFAYIEAGKSQYFEILTYGSKAVDCFVEQLRAGANGLPEYIMAVACAELTGIGDKYEGADWATAQQWLALYDRGKPDILIPKLIAKDTLTGQQAKLQSFGYAVSKGGKEPLSAGVTIWMAPFDSDETLVLDGKNGHNQILLTPKGCSLHRYQISLPDGTVYDDGTRSLYDSLSPLVTQSEDGICLTAPFQAGEYFYEIELAWPEENLTVSYGLKIVMTGRESDYDRALDSIFAAYGEGNPLISVTLENQYLLANAVSSSKRFVFRVENIPNGPIWVEVAAENGEITGRFQQYDLLYPNLDETGSYFDSGPVRSIAGNLKTYYQNTDGSWQVDGRNYRYRLVITGRMENTAVDSTFVFLSNLESIPFEQAWNAAWRGSIPAEDAVLVEWLEGGPKTMTLTDVVALSRLGMKLTWEDLEEFAGRDIGSGLYVVLFDIDSRFYLLVGDGKTTGKPMYARLNSVSTGTVCDIRESDVEAFIAKNQGEIPGATVHVVDIWDETTRAQIACDTALEKFWEDETSEYYFDCMKSQYIMVMDSTGKILDVVTALEKNLITVETLDYYGIKYRTAPKAG